MTFLRRENPHAAAARSAQSLDESRFAVTADGRFIAFARHGTDGHDRQFLWDSQTQLLVDPSPRCPPADA